MADKFGDLVRRQRLALGLTQAELAELTGLSIRSIGDLERGITAEPRSSSRRLLKRVLQLPEPAVPEPAAPEPAPAIAPRQLPAAVRGFVGRQAELATLTSMLDQADPGVMVISAIGGTAGVGKTALALHWARQVADRFPDGQLYVDLRGYDPRPEVTATEALAGFLRGLGVPGHELPPGAEDRAALYRTMLAGRRMLIMIDNAADLDQVRPLLPGSPACAVIVTSRESMPGLIARDGARRLDLDPLSDSEAMELLRALIGTRVEAAPEAAARLASLCARLPLALRVAAELAAARPASELADLAGELAGRPRRLDLLDADQDQHTAVRAVLSWSYLSLDESAARIFRLISLHPGADVDRYAAAAMTGLTPAKAGRLLDRLARAHLVQPVQPGRYVMHDLLRTYALELTRAQDTLAQRQDARTRLFDHYLCATSAAMDSYYPVERYRRPKVSPPAWYAPPVLDTADQARAWLDAECASFAPVVECAVSEGATDHAIKLAATLFRYFDTCGYYPESALIHHCAYLAATQAGDLTAQADALASLGSAGVWQGRYAEAAGHLTRALAISRQTGDLRAESRALHNLGLTEILWGRLESAAEHAHLALAIFRQLPDPVAEVRALNNLGEIASRQGHYQQAIDIHEQALALVRRTGDPLSESYILGGLAAVYRRQGRLDQAIGALTEALERYRQNHAARAEATALSDLAAMALQLGDHGTAAARSREAVAVVRQIGDVSGIAEAMNALADVLVATGDASAADEVRARLSSARSRAVIRADAEERPGVPAHDGE